VALFQQHTNIYTKYEGAQNVPPKYSPGAVNRNHYNIKTLNSTHCSHAAHWLHLFFNSNTHQASDVLEAGRQ